jgi:hypothetical protein
VFGVILICRVLRIGQRHDLVNVVQSVTMCYMFTLVCGLLMIRGMVMKIMLPVICKFHLFPCLSVIQIFRTYLVIGGHSIP